MKGCLKKYLILNKEWIRHNRKVAELFEKHKLDEEIIILDNVKFKKEVIQQLLSYEGFEPLIKINKIKQLEDMSYKQAVDKVFNNQLEFLSIPFYYVYKPQINEVVHLEYKLGDLKMRFNI